MGGGGRGPKPGRYMRQVRSKEGGVLNMFVFTACIFVSGSQFLKEHNDPKL